MEQQKEVADRLADQKEKPSYASVRVRAKITAYQFVIKILEQDKIKSPAMVAAVAELMKALR